MQFTKLGSTGLDVSRICLGCMSFGAAQKGRHTWTLDEEGSFGIIRHALEKGINFFDTANTYSEGTSESILGKALKKYARREEVVIATKVYNPVADRGPNLQGLSRKAIMTEVDASLKRLGTDYIDLYQIHRLDRDTPIEETLEAMHDVVKAGKARYIGASSMSAWEFAKAQNTAKANGWARFVSMQNFVNLLYREEEREMIPLCRDLGVGLIPWSPLARGRLARPRGATTTRTENDIFGSKLFQNTEEADGKVIDAVEALAGDLGVPMAQVALAWVLGKDVVSAPIVGATKSGHIDDAVSALDVGLTDDQRSALEESYMPHTVVGY